MAPGCACILQEECNASVRQQIQKGEEFGVNGLRPSRRMPYTMPYSCYNHHHAAYLTCRRSGSPEAKLAPRGPRTALWWCQIEHSPKTGNPQNRQPTFAAKQALRRWRRHSSGAMAAVGASRVSQPSTCIRDSNTSDSQISRARTWQATVLYLCRCPSHYEGRQGPSDENLPKSGKAEDSMASFAKQYLYSCSAALCETADVIVIVICLVIAQVFVIVKVIFFVLPAKHEMPLKTL